MLSNFTDHEKKILKYGGTIFAILVFLWILFAPNRGLLDKFRTKEKLEILEAQNRMLEEENMALRREIDRLQNDPAYLEERARKDFGLLKENEVLYKFKRNKK